MYKTCIFQACCSIFLIAIMQHAKTQKTNNDSDTRITMFWDHVYNYNRVPYKFVAGDWTTCSQTCGEGLQTRKSICELDIDAYFREVEEDMCVLHGLEKPVAEKKCLISECIDIKAQWNVGNWSKCFPERCVQNGYGQQNRTLTCEVSSGTLVDNSLCADIAKPVSMTSCKHEDCKATWITGNWSQCSGECSGKGIRSRTVKCWLSINNQEAVMSYCDLTTKPIGAEACVTSPCIDRDCQDRNTYCNLAGMLRMCRYKHYIMRCCYSCKRYNQHTTANSNLSERTQTTERPSIQTTSPTTPEPTSTVPAVDLSHFKYSTVSTNPQFRQIQNEYSTKAPSSFNVNAYRSQNNVFRSSTEVTRSVADQKTKTGFEMSYRTSYGALSYPFLSEYRTPLVSKPKNMYSLYQRHYPQFNRRRYGLFRDLYPSYRGSRFYGSHAVRRPFSTLYRYKRRKRFTR